MRPGRMGPEGEGRMGPEGERDRRGGKGRILQIEREGGSGWFSLSLSLSLSLCGRSGNGGEQGDSLGLGWQFRLGI